MLGIHTHVHTHRICCNSKLVAATQHDERFFIKTRCYGPEGTLSMEGFTKKKGHIQAGLLGLIRQSKVKNTWDQEK